MSELAFWQEVGKPPRKCHVTTWPPANGAILKNLSKNWTSGLRPVGIVYLKPVSVLARSKDSDVYPFARRALKLD
jgi:hypothetical protein